jgi:formate dehydrogenase subunit gamma
VLLPAIGPDAFSDVSEAAKYVHNFTSFSFVAGLVLITVIFFRDNLPEKVDVEWLKQGGGLILNFRSKAGTEGASMRGMVKARPPGPKFFDLRLPSGAQ